jgi:hypothetical protein
MMKVFAIGTIASILLTAFGATARTTNDWVEAVIQGRQLAQQILEQQPAESFTNTGVLKIREAKGGHAEIPVKFEVVVTGTNWMSIYEKTLPTNETGFSMLTVMHDGSISNQYRMTVSFAGQPGLHFTKERSDFVATLPFAGDFLAADLGLEYFHWPVQKILKPYEMRRGRPCKVLESTNPNLASTNVFPPIPYSRVVSWIDNETLGIVQAEAYDAKGKLLKEFYPKDFKKVNGQWELGEMEMINDQTGSQTWINFDLKKHD